MVVNITGDCRCTIQNEPIKIVFSLTIGILSIVFPKVAAPSRSMTHDLKIVSIDIINIVSLLQVIISSRFTVDCMSTPSDCIPKIHEWQLKNWRKCNINDLRLIHVSITHDMTCQCH